MLSIGAALSAATAVLGGGALYAGRLPLPLADAEAPFGETPDVAADEAGPQALDGDLFRAVETDLRAAGYLPE